jgi:polyferredoxin
MMPKEMKNLRPVAPGARKIWDIQHVRYLVQFGFVAFIGFLIYNQQVLGESAGASPEAYCPMGGFESLYNYITSGGKFIAHTHLSNLVLFVALIVSAVFTKSFFCGWICPFGAVQQAITAARRWLQSKIAVLERFAGWVSAKTRPLAFLDRWLRYAKYLVLAWIIWGTITLGVMVFRDVDPWAALLNIFEPGKGIGFWVLIGVLAAAVIGDRVWCRYLCPLSPIIGWVGKISPIKVQRESDKCIGCMRCTRKCPMDIPVHEQSRVSSIECNMCLTCVDTCPAEGALELRFSLPFTKRKAVIKAEKAIS